ncbi:hypothetical protein TNCV_4786081 [Trichonephila clavipes]|nr:hypothetical protein TNCV_4786081 [Trichonephila clavipes]
MPSVGDFFQLKRRSLAGRIRRFLSAHRKSLQNYFRSIFDPKPIHTPSGGRAERKGVPRRCLLCVPFQTQESFGYVLGLLLFETRKGLSFGVTQQPIGGPRPTMPLSVFVTLGTEVHEQVFQLVYHSDEQPQCLVPKEAWYSYINPLHGFKELIPALGLEPWTYSMEAQYHWASNYDISFTPV